MNPSQQARDDVLNQIAQLCQQAQRQPASVQLLAVSKTHPSSRIEEMYAAGQQCFGENYLQEALVKIDELQHLAIEWHFIGHVQRNKTKSLAEKFDWVLFAIPAEQVKPLLPKENHYSEGIASVAMQGCYVLMLGCRNTFALPSWSGASMQGSSIQWISCNSSKPGRSPDPTLVVLSNNQWAENHKSTDLQQIQRWLWTSTAQIMDLSSDQIEHMSMHYWRYANCIQPLQAFELLDKKSHLALCGDWTQGAKVEVAYLSGQEVAHELITHLL